MQARRITDYYAVDLPKAGRVGLNFKFPAGLGTGFTYTLNIYGANGTNLYSFDLDGSAADGSWLAGQGTFLPAGRAYIRIYGYDSAASWGKTYTLNTTLSAGTVELEPNEQHRDRNGGAPGNHGFRFDIQRKLVGLPITTPSTCPRQAGSA